MMRRTYQGAVVAGQSGFGVTFPDVPGVISAGDTMEELVRMAHEALQFHIEGLVEDGENIPEPTEFDLDWVRGEYDDPEDQVEGEEWVALISVTVEIPPYPDTVPVALDTDMVRAIDRAGMNRREFVAAATRRELDRLKKPA
jgi:predicted RNase H-like HicB family nuclease